MSTFPSPYVYFNKSSCLCQFHTTTHTPTSIGIAVFDVQESPFSESDGQVLQQTLGITMATNCVPLMVGCFLSSHGPELIEKYMKGRERERKSSYEFPSEAKI